MNSRRSNDANTIELPHVCPCKDFDCNENPVVAYSWEEVEKYFGFRTLPAGIAPQPWCKKCRAKGNSAQKSTQ